MSRHVSPSSGIDPLAGISPIRSRPGGAAAASLPPHDVSRRSPSPAAEEQEEQQQQPTRRRATNRLTVRLVVTAIQMVIRFMASIQERRFITCGGAKPWWADANYFGRFGRGAAVQAAAGEVVAAPEGGGDAAAADQEQQHGGGDKDDDRAGIIHGDREQEEADAEFRRQQQRLIEQAEQRSLRRQRRRIVSDGDLRRIAQQSGFDELPEATVSSRFDTIDEHDVAMKLAAQQQLAATGEAPPANFAGTSSSSTGARVHTVSTNKEDVVEVLKMSVADAAKTLEEIPLAEDFELFPPRLIQGIFRGIRESHAFIADLLRYRVLRRRRFREEMTGFPAEVANSALAARRKSKASATKVLAPGETAQSQQQQKQQQDESSVTAARFLPHEDEAIKLICEAAKNSVSFRDWPDSIFQHVCENSAMWRRARSGTGAGGVVAGGRAGPVRRYLPGEPIVYHGEADGRVVYFLLRGAVWEVEKQNSKERPLSLSVNARAKNLHGVAPSVSQEVISALNNAAAQAERENRQAAMAVAKASSTSSPLRHGSLAAMLGAGNRSTTSHPMDDDDGDEANFVPRRRHARSNSMHSARSSATGTTATTAFICDDLHEMSRRMFGEGSSSINGGSKFAAAAAGSHRPCVLRDGAAVLHNDQNHRAFIAASTCVVAQLPFADLEDCFCGSDGVGGTCGSTYLPNSASEWLQLARARKRLLLERSGRTRHMNVQLLKKSLLLAELPDNQADTLVGHVRACSFLKNASIIPREFDMKLDNAFDDHDGGGGGGGGGGGNLALSAAKERCEAIFCSDPAAMKTLRESIVWVVKGTAAASSRRRTKSSDMKWTRVVFFSFPAGATLGESACYFNKAPVFDVVATTMVDVLYLPRQALLQKTMFDTSFRTAINDGALVLRQSSSVTALTIRTLRAVNWIRRAIDLELISDQHLFDATTKAFCYRTMSPGEMIAATSDEVGGAFVLAAGTAVYNNQPNGAQKFVPHWQLIGSEAAVFPALRWARGVVAMTVCEVWYATPQLLRKHMILEIPQALRVVADDGVSIVATRPKHRSGDHSLKGAVARQQRFLENVHERELLGRGIRETPEQKHDKAKLFFAAVNSWDDSVETKRIKLAALRQVAVDQFDLQTDTVRCVKRATTVKKKQHQQQNQHSRGQDEQQQHQHGEHPSSETSAPSTRADDKNSNNNNNNKEDEIDFTKATAAEGLARVQKLKQEHALAAAKVVKVIDRIGPPDRKQQQKQQQEHKKTAFPAGSGSVRKKEKYGLATPLPDGPDPVQELQDQQKIGPARERCRRNWDEIVDYSSPENRLRSLLDSQQKLQETLHSPPKLPVHMALPHSVRRAPIEEQEHFEEFKAKQEEHKMSVMRGGEFSSSGNNSPSPDPGARRHLDRYRPTLGGNNAIPSLQFDHRRRMHHRDDFGLDSVRVVRQGDAEEEMAGTPIQLPSASPEQQPQEQHDAAFDSVVDANGTSGSPILRQTEQSSLDVNSPKHDATRRMEQQPLFRRENSADLRKQQQLLRQHTEDPHSAVVPVVARADDQAVAPSPVTLAELSAAAETSSATGTNRSLFHQNPAHATDASATNQQLGDEETRRRQQQRNRRDKQQQQPQHRHPPIGARHEAAAASLIGNNNNASGVAHVQGFTNMNVRSILGVTSSVPLHTKKSLLPQHQQHHAWHNTATDRIGRTSSNPQQQQQRRKKSNINPRSAAGAETPPPWDSTMSTASPAALAAAIIHGSISSDYQHFQQRDHQQRSTFLEHLQFASPPAVHSHHQQQRRHDLPVAAARKHASTPQPRGGAHSFDAHLVALEQQRKLTDLIEARRRELREGRGTPSPHQQQPRHQQQQQSRPAISPTTGMRTGLGAAGRRTPHAESRNPGLPPMRPLAVAKEGGLRRMLATSPLHQGGSLVARARELIQMKVQSELEAEQQQRE